MHRRLRATRHKQGEIEHDLHEPSASSFLSTESGHNPATCQRPNEGSAETLRTVLLHTSLRHPFALLSIFIQCPYIYF